MRDHSALIIARDGTTLEIVKDYNIIIDKYGFKKWVTTGILFYLVNGMHTSKEEFHRVLKVKLEDEPE